MTAKDWLVEINKWLRKNGYPMYDMKRLSKFQWAIVKQYGLKIKSITLLPTVLSSMEEENVLKKHDCISRYAVACLDTAVKKVENTTAEKKKKEKIQSEAGENVKRWEKEKREHPEKFGIPENLLDRFM